MGNLKLAMGVAELISWNLVHAFLELECRACLPTKLQANI